MRRLLCLCMLLGWGTLASARAAERIVLEASAARINGSARYEASTRNIGYWSSVATRVSWTAHVASAGTYNVRIVYACQQAAAGSKYDVLVGNQKANGTVRGTGTGWHTYVEEDLGPVILRKPGPVTVEVVPLSKTGQAVMNLQRIILQP